MNETKLREIYDEFVRVENADVSDAVAPEGKEALVESLLAKKKAMAGRGRSPSPLMPPEESPPEAAPAPAPEPTPEPTPEPASAALPTAAEVGAAIVIQERARTKQKGHVLVDARGQKLPDGERTKLIPVDDKPGVALEVTLAKADEEHRVFRDDRHTFRVASFNSLKLRTGRAGLMADWYQLAAALSTCDVLAVQEVPHEGSCKSFAETRAYALKLLLEHQTNSEWTAIRSEASGPGNLEVHVAFVRKPIEVVDFITHKTACGVPLEHAPLTVKIRVPGFERDEDQVWVVTSVHLPPKTRAKDRDVQLQALLKDYARSADFRLSTPLTEKGAKDARVSQVNHVVCGDFNRWVDPDEFELKKRGFAPPVLPEQVSTSVGGGAYDNFLVSKNASARFLVSVDVLELTIAKIPGQDALSDHSPVVLCIKGAPTTKDKKKKPKDPTPRCASPGPRRPTASKETPGALPGQDPRPVEGVEGVLV